jgi:hypothetical protein
VQSGAEDVYCLLHLCGTGDKPVVRPEDLVLAPDADGRQRHVRKLDEKLVKRWA